jgi:multidrug efflux system membrane fusion protein
MGKFQSRSFVRQHVKSIVLLVAAILFSLLLASCGATGSSASDAAAAAAKAAPAASVTVTEVAQRSVPMVVTAIGNAQPYRTVQVKSMVDGQISRVLIRQGQYVQAGELMFQLDQRPFQAALDQAEGKLAQDKATAAYNRAMARRDNILEKDGVIAVQVAEQQQALAESGDAAVQADKAAVETAKVNLGYTDIRAPIKARAGAILVNLGNLVKANDTTPITTLNQIEPIYVEFSVPESQLPAIRANGGIGHLKVQAFPQNNQKPSVGVLSFIDNTVDTTTGTIKLMATFPNLDRGLWPGEFFNVQLMLGVEPHATVVPAKAVQSGQQGQYVYVVRPDNTAVVQPVVSPRTYNQLAVIQSGLQPGERVIIDGQIQVVPNTKVNVVRTVPVAPSTAQMAEAENAPGDSGGPQ